MEKVINAEKLEKAAYILKTVAHPTRLAVINLLDQNERLSVNEICQLLACEQSLISHHLTNMKIKGLLKADKQGVQFFYSIKERGLIALLECIEKCDCNM